MSHETNSSLEKISPAERARGLAQKAKEKREQQEGEQQARKAERYSDLKERLRVMGEALAEKRRELKEVQDGLNEIRDIEQEGTVTDELTELRVQLEGDKAALEEKMREDEQAIQAVETDPLYVEMIALEFAATSEAERVHAEAQGALRKKEAAERAERAGANLDTVIREISSAIEVAERRERDIRTLRAEKEKLEKEKGELEKDVETDIGELLYALPEKQQRGISEAVIKARTSGSTIYASNVGIGERRMVDRPAASTISEWFSAWRESVAPSFFIFLDKPLRALLAFESDARLEKFRGLQGKIQELTDKERTLFDDRKKTNSAYIERFLAEDSAASTLDEASLQLLRSGDGLDKTATREKLQKLTELRSRFTILLADVGNDRYRQYNDSRFRNLWLSPDA
jgi:hypothetical protein